MYQIMHADDIVLIALSITELKQLLLFLYRQHVGAKTTNFVQQNDVRDSTV